MQMIPWQAHHEKPAPKTARRSPATPGSMNSRPLGFVPTTASAARHPAPPTIALVDLASVCPSGNEQSHVDALDLIGVLVRGACGRKAEYPGIHEVECRVYGGFRDITGKPTERRAWLARNLAILRGLRDGVRIIPGIADSIVCASDVVLKGTYANGRQTMVDAMIAEDAESFARSGEHSSILLVSDDEDFVPVVLSISRTTNAVIRWVRQRPNGRNDDALGESTILLTDARWQ